MIALYELKGRDDRRYSLFSWRVRMALKHKGLPFETRAVLQSDKETIAFSGGRTVPVIRDGETVVRDSWAIAEYLEKRYPQGYSLLGDAVGHGLSLGWNLWVDRVVVPAMLPAIVADVHANVDPADQVYFRGNMEKFLGCTLEEAGAGAAQAMARFSKVVDPVRSTLKRHPWICGAAPAYADYALFAVFQWARVMSAADVLPGADDPLRAWRERVLDLHGGYARDVKIA